jgi:hypothetical protein
MANDFSIRISGVKEALDRFSADVVLRAINRTYKDLATGVVSQAVGQITDEYNIKPTDVKSRIKADMVRQAGETVAVTITAKGKGLPLALFGARQAGVRTAKGKLSYTKRARRVKGALWGGGTGVYGGDVTVMIRTGQTRDLVSGKYGNKPFLAIVKGGRTRVWERKGPPRYPVGERFGPGVGGIFGTKKVQAALQVYIGQRWASGFDHNLKYYSGA